MSNSITDYWNDRYLDGKYGSGPGSRGAEAERKAAFVNALVEEHHVNRVIDWGCGDGEVARLIRSRRYIGLDVSEVAIALCGEHAPLPRRTWYRFDGSRAPKLPPGGLALSLDVIFHLTDDRLYRRHLKLVFGSAPLVCIHSSNFDEAGEFHVLHREFLPDVPAGWDLLSRPEDDRAIGFWVFQRHDEVTGS